MITKTTSSGGMCNYFGCIVVVLYPKNKQTDKQLAGNFRDLTAELA